MSACPEVIVFGCRQDDLAVLRSACRPEGPMLRSVKSAAELARSAIAGHPVAVILGVARRTLADLDVIPVIRAARGELPVIVVAEDDSLDLERRARQKNIFYYLVHPIEATEAQAVLADVLRHMQE